MTVREKIEAYFDEHADEMLKDLEALIRIPSVRGEPLKGKPFGEEPARALQAALGIARKKGLKIKNYDNYVGTADLCDAATKLGILAHLDVMPEGTGWSYPAFDMTRADGRVYGRGTADDKGPAVAALYAMCAAKKICSKPKANARLILGTDEECGSSDIAYYFKKEAAPPHVFSPDSDFPVLNREKGRLATIFEKKWGDQASVMNFKDENRAKDDPYSPKVSKHSETGLKLLGLRGGVRHNAVPDIAECLIEGAIMDVDYMGKKENGSDCLSPGILNLINEISDKTGITFAYKVLEGGRLRISARGVNAHGSMPQCGNNALTGLLELVSFMPLRNDEEREVIKGLHACFPHGDTMGKALGIEYEDQESGALTLNLGILELNQDGFKAQIDLRSPVTADQKFIIDRIREAISGFGATITDEAIIPPHVVPPDDPFVKTLLSIYHDYTGKEAYLTSTGGGTYVHDIKGGVGFGCTMPGVDNHMHGADEFAIVDDLILSAKMFTQAILDICG